MGHRCLAVGAAVRAAAAAAADVVAILLLLLEVLEAAVAVRLAAVAPMRLVDVVEQQREQLEPFARLQPRAPAQRAEQALCTRQHGACS